MNMTTVCFPIKQQTVYPWLSIEDQTDPIIMELYIIEEILIRIIVLEWNVVHL